MITTNKINTKIYLIAILSILSIASIFIGAMDISGIFKSDTQALTLLLVSRIPRLMAIICTGMGMSVAGLIMQKLCMNNFVSPTTGTTIAGAQLGILLSIFWLPKVVLWQRTAMAFVFSILATWIFVWFINRVKYKDIIMVPLIGIMMSTVLGAITSQIAYSNDLTQALATTITGSFALVIAGRYEIVYLVFPLILIAYLYSNHFNIVGMGEDFAKNLGVSYKLVLFFGLSISAMITASIVVTVGTISYIGLIIPNLVSMFKGDKIKGTFWDIALFGAIYVLVCDIIGRTVITPYELPIELISGIVGSVLFLVFMFKRLHAGGRVIKKDKVQNG